MCGIAGVWDRDGAPAETGVLERMAATIAHRGPDGDGFYVDGPVGLAHRALHIIDLSDAAFQPMVSADGQCALVYNGEIYNYVELMRELRADGHRFRGHSDTEALLAGYQAWGLDCLAHFNGMWAFALWDRARQRLFLARDRLGIKPLYYWWDGRRLVFASEIKALLTHPAITAQPNGAAIAEYWQAMYTTGDHTWFQGIKRLLPGEYLLADATGIHVARYWDLPTAEDPPGRWPTTYAADVRRLLDDSIRLCLRSDVPLGAHLSGGVDSSAIVGLLSGQLGDVPVRTFSGAFDAGPAYDERPYIAAVAARYHTDHHEVVPAASDLPAVLPRLVWHLDEPVAGPGAFPQYAVCRLTRESGVTVVNGGQGGDELFGGYFGYVPAYLRSLAGALRRRPSAALLGALLGAGARVLAQAPLRGAALGALRAGRRGRLRADTAGAALPTLFGPALRDLDYAPADGPAPASGTRSPLGEALAYDVRHYLPALLQVEDRMSMAWSIESRVPLLDYRLVELAMRIPPEIKLRNLETKAVLRAAVADLLPPIVAARRDKKGFPTPIAPWFRGPLAPWLREQLLGPGAAARGLFDARASRRLVEEHVAGDADHSRVLWQMLNMESWFAQFVEGADGAANTAAGMGTRARPGVLRYPGALEAEHGG